MNHAKKILAALLFVAILGNGFAFGSPVHTEAAEIENESLTTEISTGETLRLNNEGDGQEDSPTAIEEETDATKVPEDKPGAKGAQSTDETTDETAFQGDDPVSGGIVEDPTETDEVQSSDTSSETEGTSDTEDVTGDTDAQTAEPLGGGIDEPLMSSLDADTPQTMSLMLNDITSELLQQTAMAEVFSMATAAGDVSVELETLEELIAALKGQSGSYSLSKSFQADSITDAIVVENDISLDLNGKNIFLDNTLKVESGGKLTLVNSASSEGKITRGDKHDGAMIEVEGTLVVGAQYGDEIDEGMHGVSLDGGGRDVADALVAVDNGGALVLNDTGTLMNNLNRGTNGGAVKLTGEDSSLEMNGGTLHSNEAANGGGIYADGGTLTITGGTIQGNRVTGNGGAIYTSVDNTSVSGVVLTNNEANQGGGLYASGESLAMQDTTVTGNRANEDGAGVYIIGDNAALENVTVINNNAQGNGAGIYVDGDAFTLTNSTINFNRAEGSGGGVYTRGVDIHLTDNNLEWNRAEEDGGALFATGEGLEISGGEMTGNSSYKDGGAIYTDIENAALDGIDMRGNVAGENGGGIYTSGDGTTLTNMNVNYGGATKGGGIYVAGDGTILTTVTMASNNAGTDGEGGGLYVGAKYTVLAGSLVENNGSSAGKGGGIAISDEGSLTVGADAGGAATTITGNTAQMGGGVSVTGNGIFVMETGANLYNNNASDAGGDISADGTATLGLVAADSMDTGFMNVNNWYWDKLGSRFNGDAGSPYYDPMNNAHPDNAADPHEGWQLVANFAPTPIPPVDEPDPTNPPPDPEPSESPDPTPSPAPTTAPTTRPQPSPSPEVVDPTPNPVPIEEIQSFLETPERPLQWRAEYVEIADNRTPLSAGESKNRGECIE